MDGIKGKSEAAEKNVKFPEKVFDSEKVKEWITNISRMNTGILSERCVLVVRSVLLYARYVTALIL